MKKFLLFISITILLVSQNKLIAQCSGAVIINNFAVLAPGNTINYSFDWQYVQGNASIQVVDSCNGQFEQASCIPSLKDSAAGIHHVAGSFPTTCNGIITVAILIWTNNSCGGNSCEAASRTIAHIPLPVRFISFNAKRNNSSSVSLTWQTAMESNNSGFAVERNTDGLWNQVAFVPSQAPDGNSQTVLSYSYTDQNNSSGITQYRIRQIDIDGQSKYSEVRAVRGLAQSGNMIVYPNPSSTGTVSVVFEDAAGLRDISLTDMTGRLVKNWQGVSNNNLQIDNLTPGFYALRVIVRETGEQTVKKIVVDKQ